MSKKNFNILIVAIIVSALLIAGGSFAFWLWTSNVNKNVVFNTANLEDYIVYDEGNSYFIGNFMPADTFCEAANTTISFYKKEEAFDIPIYATIKMDINSIGTNVSSSNSVYWVVTTGNNTSCEGLLDSSNVLSYGTLNGKQNGETLTLHSNIEVLMTSQQFTIWLWIDSAGENLSSLSGETIDTNVWTEFTMKENSPNIEFDDHTLMITSYTCDDSSGNPVTVGNNPYFTYTGQCEVIDDGNGDWRIRFLTDGTFTSTLNIPIDVFLVGGGGGGGSGNGDDGTSGGGGGGGYTTTTFTNVKSGEPYLLVIGEGGVSENNGEDTTGFGAIAFSGGAGKVGAGGHGGSGGDNSWGSGGGSNGSDGLDSGGTGQETTTCEFGELGCSSDKLYSGGGGGAGNGGQAGGAGGGGNGGYYSFGVGEDGEKNTGGGGGGGGYTASGGSGGSGIIVIRNTRIDSSDVSKLPTVAFDFTYVDGYYAIEHESGENWKIKFLTGGTFTSTLNIPIDVFLVGGGGGGGSGSGSGDTSGGGGGGGYTKTASINIVSELPYSLVIGEGGGSETAGEDTTGFGLIAAGGKAGGVTSGGAGGSGGASSWSSGGGSNGSNGTGSSGGSGQKSVSGPNGETGNTSEFGVDGSKLYSGGGGGAGNGGQAGGSGGGGNAGYYGYGVGADAALGTGGGGNAGYYGYGVGADAALGTGGGGGGGGYTASGGSGGSGILIIRNARE